MSDENDPLIHEQQRILSLDSNPPGWLLDVYSSETDAGLVISRLDIRVDPNMDTPTTGITSTIINNIRLPEIRSQIVERVELAASRFADAISKMDADDPAYELVARAHDQAERMREAAAPDLTRRTTLKRRQEWAEQAEEALAAGRQARAENCGIGRVLEQKWDREPEGVKTRLRRLKKRGYIIGRGRNVSPGPTLQERRRYLDSETKEI